VLNEKLGEEVVAHRCLEKKLGEANAMVHKESSEHNTLRAAVGLVLNDFEMTSEPGMSSRAVQVDNVMDRGARDGEAGAAPRRAAVIRYRAFSLREHRPAGDETRLRVQLR
jgi:hypothetical protein